MVEPPGRDPSGLEQVRFEVEALRELVRRREARGGLLAFCRFIWPGFKSPPHIEKLAGRLEAVERGELRRLIVSMPPRHGKSLLVSHLFPAWYLGRNPGKQFISAAYNAEKAGDYGQAARNVVGSGEYGKLFPSGGLAEDSRAAGRWLTKEGGVYVAAGVGTAVTGRGAHVFSIDDPVKDRADAESETVRNGVWDWFRSTAYTRLEPNGSIILTSTRWHEDDPAGRILTEATEDWEVINFPALAKAEDPLGREEGEALWPERFPKEVLETIRGVIGPREWSALYQQEPTPESGEYFKRDWIKFYDKLPDELTYWGASDYAVTANGGDYTVHGVAGVDALMNLYLIDWWRQRTDTEQWVRQFLIMSQRWKTAVWAEEKGQIVKSLEPFIERMSRDMRIFPVREQFPSVRDKGSRARSIQGRFSMGKVFLPRNAGWSADLMAELLSFPAGKYDDQVDVLSLFGRMLDQMYGRAYRPTEILPEGPNSGAFVLSQFQPKKKDRYA